MPKGKRFPANVHFKSRALTYRHKCFANKLGFDEARTRLQNCLLGMCDVTRQNGIIQLYRLDKYIYVYIRIV